MIAIVALSVVVLAAVGWLVVQRRTIRGLRRGEATQALRLDGMTSEAAHRDAAIDRLHDEASVSDLEIEHLRSEAHAAAAELDDLRAVRDVLTPLQPLRDRPGVHVATVFEPHAGGVGGDFFLVTGGPHGTTVLVMGDVVGKGLGAARRATFVRTAIALAAPYVDDPTRVLELANQALLGRDEDDDIQFVTAICVVFAPLSRTVRWSSAGHPPPLWLDDGAELDSRPGLPLGVQPALNATTCEREGILPGAGVLLFTDGLIEARDGDGGQYGAARASRVLRDVRGGRAEDVLSALCVDLDAYETAQRSDDLCLLAVRFV